MKQIAIRKVAVLGAGVMGAQIAAHCVNARACRCCCSTWPTPSRPEERHRAAGHREPEQAQSRRRSALKDDAQYIEAANYDGDLEQLSGVRPGDRGDRRAHGLEARPVPQGRAAHRAERDLRVQHVGAVDHQPVRRLLDAALRPRFCGVHFFNPPRYMHLVELIPTAGHRRRGARSARNLPDEHARQGRRARQGHAQLHRQPRRRVRHAGHDARSRKVRARLRRGRRPDGHAARARQERRRSARPTWSDWTRWRT